MRITDPRDHNEEATLILNWKRASFSSLKPVNHPLANLEYFPSCPSSPRFQREVAVAIGRR
jgi:hypothetical protein